MESDYHKKRYEEYAAFGLPLEQTLKPVLEKCVGSALVKTASTTDTADFCYEGGYAELKCRRPHHQKEDYACWVFPVDKVLKGIVEEKPVRIFYYWDSDKSLYYIDYSENLFFDSKKIPEPDYFPGSSQKHFWIPQYLWKRVNWR